jgi:adenylosuccinate synthase
MIDFDFVGRAAAANSATEIVLTGIDYFDREMHNRTRQEQISEKSMSFISAMSRATQCPVTFISTGAETTAMIEIDQAKKKIGKDGLPLLEWHDKDSAFD